MDKKYNIGLDIGTSSIGFVATDEENHVIRAKGKNVIGVRLFDEGQSAAERRGFRTTRRRLNRRKWRLNLLREIFEPHIYPIDASFFMRQKYSNLSKQDPNQKIEFKDILFSDKSDAEFYRQYPTIYHLRQALMTEKRQFDLREIYLAIHHIVKYRGHFLDETPTDKFSFDQLDLTQEFERLNVLFSEQNPEEPFEIVVNQNQSIEDILSNQSMTASDRRKQALVVFYQQSENKENEKQYKAIATEILNLLLGNKAKLNVILAQEVDKEAAKDWSLSLSSETFDDDLEKASSGLNDSQLEMIGIFERIYSSLVLKSIIGDHNSLSAAMVDKFKTHAQHRDLLKDVIKNSDATKGEQLQFAYDHYLQRHSADGKAYGKDDFYKEVKKNLDDSDAAQQIQQLIDTDQFMPKQRTKANGAIPHQVQQKELDLIIENQCQYYPWLAEENPNSERHNVAKYKLDELVSFRVPYYVGPLISPADDETDPQAIQNTKFAWMIRKDAQGRITPWNFDDKVDREKSADKFIKRMTTTDTYLIGEDVLPDQSLIYQRYKVLNELNNVRINGRPIEVQIKQNIYTDLFKKFKSVSVKKLRSYLEEMSYYPGSFKISGLTNPDKFDNGLTSYLDYKNILGDSVDANDKRADIEQMIEWSTIFEDTKIFAQKLESMTWLTSEQRKAISRKRYTGWGRLSNKLLTQLKNQDNRSIMDLLWETEENFMKIQSAPDFSKMIEAHNQQFIKNEANIQQVISDLYTSPQNKKAIRQILLVVDDIQKAVGHAPEHIAIEFAKGEDKNPRRTISREMKIQDVYQQISDDILVSPEVRAQLNEKIENRHGRLSDRLFLYFMQGGRDMYTGKPININNISHYDIDHILPQAFIKDDSLDNRVLVSDKLNREKSDTVPRDLFGREMMSTWEKMADRGLITKRKLANLKTIPGSIDAHKAQGFINRQLVETRQVIKLAVGIMIDQYPETQIVSVKANLTHEMREMFDLVKNRDVNDYHHAFDAYLTAFVGNYLLQRYPKLEPYFVYDKFKKLKDQNISMRDFNLLYDLKKNEDVYDQRTGHSAHKIWDQHGSIDYIRHLFAYKKILVSHEVHQNGGALYNMTVYGKADDAKRKLIPIKADKPTELYGGYTSRKLAYMAIVKTKKGKKEQYQVTGVPVSALTTLRQFKEDSPEQKQALEEIVRRNFDEKTEVEIIVPKVLFNQLIVDEKCRFMVGSDTYRYNAQQLVLSADDLEIINASHQDIQAMGPSIYSEQLNQVYLNILTLVNKFFPMYDINKFRTKLHDGYEQFVELPNEDVWENNKLKSLGKRTIIVRILQGLHANATVVDLKQLGIKTPFGLMQQPRGIVVSPDAQLIYQSPTGLYERRVRLGDL